MQWAPDPTDLWAPDSERARAWASDSSGHLTLIQAVDLFLAAKAAEGVSPKTSTWYRMILVRLTRAFDWLVGPSTGCRPRRSGPGSSNSGRHSPR